MVIPLEDFLYSCPDGENLPAPLFEEDVDRLDVDALAVEDEDWVRVEAFRRKAIVRFIRLGS